MPGRIGDRDLAAMLGALEGIERRCLPGPRPPVRVFRRSGRLLLAQDWISGRLLSSPLRPGAGPGVPPPLRRLGAWRLARARLAGARYAAATAGVAIAVDRSMRIFYPPAIGRTIKLCDVAMARSNLTGEVEVRRRVQATGTVRLPPIFEDDLNGPQPFLCEATVDGRRLDRPEDHAAVREQIVPAFTRLYEACGIGRVLCGEFFDLPRLRARSHQVIAQACTDASARSRLTRWLEGMEALAGATLPASLGHGDLSLANMVATERDGIWVVDWERAGPMPVLWDWRKLFEQVGLAREAYARFVRRHGGGEMTPADALPLAEQWRIVAVARVAEIVESLEAGGRLRSRHAHQRLARAAAAAATAVAGDGVAP